MNSQVSCSFTITSFSGTDLLISPVTIFVALIINVTLWLHAVAVLQSSSIGFCRVKLGVMGVGPPTGKQITPAANGQKSWMSRFSPPPLGLIICYYFSVFCTIIITQSYFNIHCVPKREPLNYFTSYFTRRFYMYALQKISTSSAICCYTTLWNSKIQIFCRIYTLIVTMICLTKI